MTAPSRPVRLVLNGRPIEVVPARASLMLLEWLRIEQRATGTKEGCAEGDCGACMVAVAHRAANGEVRIEPRNACILPLASVDGCAVLTVEGLGGAHPVQASMVEHHGSQCGFCTPGFVVCMASRLAVGPVTTRSEACEALAGNLCRCTGYRPIIDALQAASAVVHAAPAGQVATTPSPAAGLPQWMNSPPDRPAQALSFRVAEAQWFSPRTPQDVDALLVDHPDAWLLAGGTDIGLWVTKALREPKTWIRLGDVDALHTATAGEQVFEIGAAVSLAQAFALMRCDWPEFDRYWARFASPAIRASGTLVGNLANGSPIGDAAPVLIALGASVVLRRAGGVHGTQRRVLPLQDLYIDYRVQRREPGEWIESVRVPRRRVGQIAAAHKLSRRFEQDISAVSLALCAERGDRLHDVRIALGGMAGIVKRATAAERVLEGAEPSVGAFERAAAALSDDFTPLDDLRASRQYRLTAAAGLLVRIGHALHGHGPVSVEDPVLDAAVNEGASN